MLENHYINIGMPKCGTTWLFDSLIQSTQIDYTGNKEPPLSYFDTESSYKSYFNKYNYSLNFNPSLWALDRSQIRFIKKYATHCSIILRNPYELVVSLYNFLKSSDEFDLYIIAIQHHLKYSDIVSRWQNHENFKIFFYSNLKLNQQEYLNSVTEYLGLLPISALAPIGVTVYNTPVVFSKWAIQLINDEIFKLEDLIQEDLSSWRR
jgi:hypothetical protein